MWQNSKLHQVCMCMFVYRSYTALTKLNINQPGGATFPLVITLISICSCPCASLPLTQRFDSSSGYEVLIFSRIFFLLDLLEQVTCEEEREGGNLWGMKYPTIRKPEGRIEGSERLFLALIIRKWIWKLNVLLRTCKTVAPSPLVLNTFCKTLNFEQQLLHRDRTLYKYTHCTSETSEGRDNNTTTCEMSLAWKICMQM